MTEYSCGTSGENLHGLTSSHASPFSQIHERAKFEVLNRWAKSGPVCCHKRNIWRAIAKPPRSQPRRLFRSGTSVSRAEHRANCQLSPAFLGFLRFASYVSEQQRTLSLETFDHRHLFAPTAARAATRQPPKRKRLKEIDQLLVRQVTKRLCSEQVFLFAST